MTLLQVVRLEVFVAVLDINDNAPKFSFEIKTFNVSEDTKVNTTVIPETQLKATDADINDILVYTLQEVTPVSASPATLIIDNPHAF